MNAISSPRAYMRSLATRESEKALSRYVQEAIDICKEAGYDFIILESAGVGQSDASILDYCDISLYVMTPEYGAASQLEKLICSIMQILSVLINSIKLAHWMPFMM
jgi:methylmalonyl-CoA mutase